MFAAGRVDEEPLTHYHPISEEEFLLGIWCQEQKLASSEHSAAAAAAGTGMLGQDGCVCTCHSMHCQWWGELQKHLLACVMQAFDF